MASPLNELKDKVENNDRKLFEVQLQIDLLKSKTNFLKDNWDKILTTVVLACGLIFGAIEWKAAQENSIRDNKQADQTQNATINSLRHRISELTGHKK